MTIELNNIGYQEVPAGLSTSVLKRQLYAIDPFFREGWEHIEALMGNRATSILDGITCIVFKPDAFAGRKVIPALDWLCDQGFEPIAFSAFSYNRNIIREDWRYQYNIATRARINLVDMLLTTAPSLFVVLKGPALRKGGPTASETLKLLKGPSQPELRVPGHLRYDLGIVSTFINFIHTTDESADIPRALSLYFTGNERAVIIRQMMAAKEAGTELREAVKEMYQCVPQHDLDYARSLERIAEGIMTQPGKLDEKDKAYFLSAIAAMRNKEANTDWIGFFEWLRQKGVTVCIWDEVLVSAELVIPNFAEGHAIIA